MSAPGKPAPVERPEPRRLDQAARILLPVGVLALGILAWDLVVRLNAIPPYVLPGPRLVFTTMWADRALLLDSLLVHAHHHARGLCAGAPGRDRAGGAVQPVALDRILALIPMR